VAGTAARCFDEMAETFGEAQLWLWRATNNETEILDLRATIADNL
jgi:hypothetical protein